MNKLKEFSNINLLLLKTNDNHQLQKHLKLFYTIKLLSINSKVAYNFPTNDIKPLIDLGFIKHNQITKAGKLYLKLLFGHLINKIQKLVKDSVDNSIKYFNNIIKSGDFERLNRAIKEACPLLERFDLYPIDDLLFAFSSDVYINSADSSQSIFWNFEHFVISKIYPSLNDFSFSNPKYFLLETTRRALNNINDNPKLYYLKTCKKPKLSVFPKDGLYNIVNKYKSHDTQDDLLNFLVKSHSYPNSIFNNPVGFEVALSKIFK